jgi:hypothetical protein
MTDDELTLAAGWTAFAANLTALPEYRQTDHTSYRQAYRNGVAAVVARSLVRGPEAITRYFDAFDADPKERIDHARASRVDSCRPCFVWSCA